MAFMTNDQIDELREQRKQDYIKKKLPVMTYEEKDKIYCALAQNATDQMDLGDLQEYFYSNQYSYYTGLSDVELEAEIDQLKEMGIDINDL